MAPDQNVASSSCCGPGGHTTWDSTSGPAAIPIKSVMSLREATCSGWQNRAVSAEARLPALVGSTKSNTMASASWPGATAPAGGCSLAMAMISRLGFRLRSRRCGAAGPLVPLDGEAIVTNDKGLAVFVSDSPGAQWRCRGGVRLRSDRARRRRFAPSIDRAPQAQAGAASCSPRPASCSMSMTTAMARSCSRTPGNRLRRYCVKVACSPYRAAARRLGGGHNPKAPAVKREAEEDWGR